MFPLFYFIFLFGGGSTPIPVSNILPFITLKPLLLRRKRGNLCLPAAATKEREGERERSEGGGGAFLLFEFLQEKWKICLSKSADIGLARPWESGPLERSNVSVLCFELPSTGTRKLFVNDQSTRNDHAQLRLLDTADHYRERCCTTAV